MLAQYGWLAAVLGFTQHATVRARKVIDGSNVTVRRPDISEILEGSSIR
jgi:hypothetical protein